MNNHFKNTTKMKPSFFGPLSIISLFITILFLHQISIADAHKGVVIKSGNLRAHCITVLEKVLSMADGIKSTCPEAYKKLVDDVGDAIQKLQTEQPVPMVVVSIKSAIKDVVSCFRVDVSPFPLLELLHIALGILKRIK